jgi:hypothetical protein
MSETETITVWAVRTDGFGGGKVYSTVLTVQHVVMQLNFSQDLADDTTYFINENYARANLAYYIINHPANQPIKGEEE